MKARVIKTGEIINIIPVDGGWAANFVNGVRHFEDSELDFSFEDWEAFRREAAKDVLPAIIGKKSSMCSYGEVVEEAITFADELIKQLKEEKK